MKVLWAPWRMEYILGPKPDGCALCVPKGTGEDESRHIVWRGEHCFVVLNRYPYASGHLMVVPYRHVTDITDLDAAESADLMALTQKSCRVLRQYCKPQGINLGVNLGEAAGAGIRHHMHMHVVPRWNGDSSFMAVLDDVRVMPEHLHETWKNIRAVFEHTA